MTKEHRMQIVQLKEALRSPEFPELCRSTWQKYRLSKAEIREAAPSFAMGYKDFGSLPEELPEFETIVPEVLDLLSKGTREKVPEDDNLFTDEDPVYLLVDNGKSSSRLKYPTDANLRMLKVTPVFLVVGGNTLSRGLTLNGLTTSFFARKAGAMDTLQQMARWFGYPNEYAPLIRVWMRSGINRCFGNLADKEAQLHELIRQYSGPRGITLLLESKDKMDKLPMTGANRARYAVSEKLNCNHEFSIYRRDNAEELIPYLQGILQSVRRLPDIGGVYPIYAADDATVMGLIECIAQQDSTHVTYLHRLRDPDVNPAQRSWKIAVLGARNNAGEKRKKLRIVKDSGLWCIGRGLTNVTVSDGNNEILDISSLSDGGFNAQIREVYPDDPVFILYEVDAEFMEEDEDVRESSRSDLICCSLLLPKCIEAEYVKNAGA